MSGTFLISFVPEPCTNIPTSPRISTSQRAGATPHDGAAAGVIPQSVFDSMRQNWVNANASEDDYDEPDESEEDDEAEGDGREAA